jgi:hypothetical protein
MCQQLDSLRLVSGLAHFHQLSHPLIQFSFEIINGANNFNDCLVFALEVNIQPIFFIGELYQGRKIEQRMQIFE